MPGWLETAIRDAYAELVGDEDHAPVAVRSSATGEDTASASFAGMNETFLNVRGADAVVDAVRRCWRSLFGSRTVYYRAKRGFGQADMDIAVVVQQQVASTRAGVMFTIDPSSGDESRLVIEGAFGLGESVVSGSVSPDRYIVEKETLHILAREVRRKELAIEPTPDGGTITRELPAEEGRRPVLADEEVDAVAEMGRRIEGHYDSPQDTEWCFDPDGRLWMLQSRPITSAGEHIRRDGGPGRTVLLKGLGAAPGVASGAVRLLTSPTETETLNEGDILAAHMTAPDWVPLMRRAAGIVTDSGGMTCHAAIVSRELGIPCVVGTGEATKRLREGEVVTIDATAGVVREGAAVLPLRRPELGGGRPAAPSLTTPAPASTVTTSPSRSISWPRRCPRRRGSRARARRSRREVIPPESVTMPPPVA